MSVSEIINNYKNNMQNTLDFAILPYAILNAFFSLGHASANNPFFFVIELLRFGLQLLVFAASPVILACLLISIPLAAISAIGLTIFLPFQCLYALGSSLFSTDHSSVASSKPSASYTGMHESTTTSTDPNYSKGNSFFERSNQSSLPDSKDGLNYHPGLNARN